MSFNSRWQKRRAWAVGKVKQRKAFLDDLGRWEKETGRRHWPAWPLLYNPLWAIPLTFRRIRYARDKKKPAPEKKATMKRFSGAVLGTPIPLAFGKVGKILGTVIYASDFSGGRESGNIRPDYAAPIGGASAAGKVFITLAVAVCKGPVSAVTRIWADDTLIYKAGAGYATGYVDYSDSIAIHLGTEDQEPDRYLDEIQTGATRFVTAQAASLGATTVTLSASANGGRLRLLAGNTIEFSGHSTQYVAQGSLTLGRGESGSVVVSPALTTALAGGESIDIETGGNVPAHRGLCYVVFHGLDLERWDNSIPRFEFEIQETGTAVYATETLTLSSLDSDALVLSRQTPFMYAFADDVLHAISRVDFSEAYQVNLVDTIDAFSPGASIVSRLCLDDADTQGMALDSLLLGCRDTGGAGFVAVWGPLGSRSNASTAIPGFEPIELFGLGPNIYAADVASGSGATVRAFERRTLNLLWTRAGPDDDAIPGNFSHDAQGRLWLISYNPSDPATGASSRFWLSRYTAAGEVLHTEFTGLGRCKQLAISSQGQEIALCGGGDGGALVRIRIDGATPSSTTLLAAKTADNQRSLWVSQYRLRDNRFLSSDNESLFRVSTAQNVLTVIETIADTDHGLRLVGPAYDSLRDTVYSAEDAPAGDLVSVTLGRIEAGSKTVGAVISDLCQAAGLDGAEVSASALSSAIEGYLVDEASTAEEALGPLLEVYRVGVAETGGVLSFRSLAPVSPAAIDEDDLGAGEEAAAELFTEEAESTYEIPRAVEVSYITRDRDYSEGVQRWQRRADIFPGQTETGFTAPLVLSADSARQLAQVIALSAERESLRYALALPPKHLRVDPLDALSFPVDGATEVVRVESVEIGADRNLRIAAVRADASTYASVLEGAEAPASEQDIIVSAPTVGVVLDLPCLRDMDDAPGLYWAAGPFGPGRWQGAQLQRSADGGATFAGVLVTSAESTIASAETALQTPSSSGGTVDTTSLLQAIVLSGGFESATLAELLEDRHKNLLAVGSPENGWELVQYKTVTDFGGGRVQISGFLRGRFGTEHAQSSHQPGEMVVECSPAKLRRLVLTEGEIGTEGLYRSSTLPAPSTAASTLALSFEAVCLRPWSPVSLSAYQDPGAVKDVILLWLRRTRVGGGLVELVDAPVGDAIESYEIEIMDGITVKRTIPVSMPSAPTVNLAIDGAAQKVTRASGSWPTDGYYPGAWVELSGFADPANKGFFKIASAPSSTDLVLSNGASALVTEASASGRSVRLASPVGLYRQADQVSDFGAVVTSVTFRVYQMSAAVGRGYVSETKTQAV